MAKLTSFVALEALIAGTPAPTGECIANVGAGLPAMRLSRPTQTPAPKPRQPRSIQNTGRSPTTPECL
ncbi:hypothetical protein C7A11_17795 [Pseudomonas simiae]|nr:hypothetical protein C7A11_17795 [Pseudomonas simiae]